MTTYQNTKVRGLPGPLPEGEHVLWQGSPNWREFAVRVFHTRFVAGYFAILIAWSVLAPLWEGGTITGALASAALLTLGCALALGVLGGLAWLFARTTVYTLTNKRIAMRYGVALPMTINIPLRCVESAELRLYPSGRGDIPVQLSGTDRFAYFHLWPNARPWRYSKAEPMIRAIPNAAETAEIIGGALAEAHQAEAEHAKAPQVKKLRKSAKNKAAATAEAARPLAAAE